MKRKIIYIACFLVFGVAAGFVSVWYHNNTDTIFFFNIPGTLFGDGIYYRSIEMFGDPSSSQAHYTIPWVLRIPHVYVLASGLFWGVLGTIFSLFFKPVVILWICTVYVVILGILTILSYVF